MKRSTLFLAGSVIAVALGGPAFGLALAPAALARSEPQTVGLVRVDPQSLATGYRASKVVGSTVVNEADQSVGTINDLIITPTEKVPFAVLSVGGFLGIGTKYVVVPYSSLQVHGDKMLLPGATKGALEGLPAFKYST
jgi:hypothetical protein